MTKPTETVYVALYTEDPQNTGDISGTGYVRKQIPPLTTATTPSNRAFDDATSDWGVVLGFALMSSEVDENS